MGILVANEELVKISDFGLARSVISQTDHYVMSSNISIPVRWMAFESLTQKKYTFASDVWSFGVTLWEIFSFGKNPYLTGCENFFQLRATDKQHLEDMKKWTLLLDSGSRLPRTEQCPMSVYTDVMTPCWAKEPAQRPSFTELRRLLSKARLKVT